MATCRSESASFYDPTYYHRDGDALSCGNRRRDHDEHGNCDSCDVCHEDLCPSDDGVEMFEGLAVHRDCLLAEKRKAVMDAIYALLAAADELRKVDEEALILPSDKANTLEQRCEAYDAIDLLAAWTERNADVLGVAK